MEAIRTKELFDLSRSAAGDFLAGYEFPWQALPDIARFITDTLIPSLDRESYTEISQDVWAEKTAKIAASALIMPPAVIGEGTEIRHCAFIRGNAVIGKNCVIGNSVEVKNAIIFDGCDVPHFNYVGDSVLGFRAHMGAGAVTSNVKSDKTNVTVRSEGFAIETGLRKMGAMLGDGVEVGCNSTLNPGTVIGRGSRVYPNSCVRGVVPAKSIFKNSGEMVTMKGDK